MSVVRRSSLVALALGGLLVAGCYSFSEPSFDPGNKRDVLQSIARRGLVVSQPVVGQTACDDPDLVANSLYLTARMPDESEPRDVYVHSYREKSWAGSEAEVDDCQAIYAAAHPGAQIVRLDIPTFRVFGADWSPELTRELRAAIEEASRAGAD
ncbi:MAG TPA: hypothetical protein VFF55_00465 [Candidatus Deferrimicrobium sp.]|nr:hypothetical protein [Candidatus Deferrimicrobium sp.]